MHAGPAREALLRLAVVAAGVALGAPAGARGVEAEAFVPASGGTLRITADPPGLLLGRDAGSELRISVPADVEDVALVASAGRIEGLRRLPDGAWAARFRAPADRFPQVAIVAAFSRSPRGSEDGWLALPLTGQGEARFRAQPGAQVSLRVADRVFGPRRAGADGMVTVPVVVPPGIRQAHHGFKPIDLNVPEMPPLLAVLDRSTVLADREEQVRAMAYVAAPHGAARRGDVPSFEPSRGTVSVAEREPGAYQVTWTLPPGKAGEERLAIRLSAAPASRSLLRLEAVPGPAAVVAVSFDRRALVAGATEAVGVTARALDAAGNAVPAALEMTAEGGALEGVRERAPGVLEAQLRAGPRFGGRREVRVTASAAGVRISGGRALPLRPGEPALAVFAEDGSALRVGGTREATLRLAITDRHGNPVEAAPTVKAERGSVTRVLARGPGDYEVRYVAPAVRGPTPERIEAHVADARTVTRRILVPDRGRLAAAAAGGAAVDVRSRRRRAWVVMGAEAAADLTFLLRRGLEPAWRFEAGWLGDTGRETGTVLAGSSLRRALADRVELGVGVLAGAAFGGGGVWPAARLSAEVALARVGLAPFVEAGLVAATGGGHGEFAAWTLSFGARYGAE